MEFKISLKGIDEVKEMLSPKKLQKAVVSALDKTAKQGKTEAQRHIRDVYNIKLKDLTSKIRTDIHPSRFEAVIEAKGSRLPLMLFSPKQSGVKIIKKTKSIQINKKRRSSGSGVSVEIMRGQRKLLPGAFMAKMKSGHFGVFKRVGSARLPIVEKVTIDVVQMFGSSKVIEATKKRVIEQFDKNFSHELNREMNKK